MNILAIFLLLAGVVIPQPQSIESTDKIVDKARLAKVVYKDVKGLSDEAYELQIKKNGVVIRSSAPAGRFYAEKTLEMLTASDQVQCMTIKDEPRFEWRGYESPTGAFSFPQWDGRCRGLPFCLPSFRSARVRLRPSFQSYRYIRLAAK